MRIAFVLFNWFPHGGLQQDLIKVARACKDRAQLEVHCLAWEGERPDFVQVKEVPVRRFSKTGLREAFADHVLHKVKPAVDLVVGFNRLPGLDYYYAADSCFAHRVAHRSWWYQMTPRVRQYLRFEQAVFGGGSKTVSLLLSPLQREQYVQHYHTPVARLVDLPPGIDRKHCAGTDATELREKFRSAFNIAAHELVVLQIGSSYGTKGVDRSLAALAALPAALKHRVHYLLMGRDKHADEWRQRAKQTGLGERVHFLGPDHSVPSCMQGADVLLHPSLHESAGMVILEAVVAGLPVLTTASCGYAFHVRQANAGLVCDEPFEQRQLNELLRNMLIVDRSAWRYNGIVYGQRNNLYDMPSVVADILLGEQKKDATGKA
jgi:UDP-glucose:(heptosyl)LPS alpha-1,3-glucosyltransferase